jgi:hypothetical protein
MISSDPREITAETRIVTRKTVSTQRFAFFRSFFTAAGSDFDTATISLKFSLKTAAGKVNLTA